MFLDVKFNTVPSALLERLNPIMKQLCKEPSCHLYHASIPYKHVNRYRRSTFQCSKFQVNVFTEGKLKCLGYVTDSRVGALLVAAVFLDARLVEGNGAGPLRKWYMAMHCDDQCESWLREVEDISSLCISDYQKRVKKMLL